MALRSLTEKEAIVPCINVRVISKRANTLKNDATLEEMQAVVRYMEGRKFERSGLIEAPEALTDIMVAALPRRVGQTYFYPDPGMPKFGDVLTMRRRPWLEITSQLASFTGHKPVK